MYKIFNFEEWLTFGCTKYKHSKVANICQHMSGIFGGIFGGNFILSVWRI